jgi:hypothetical protein
MSAAIGSHAFAVIPISDIFERVSSKLSDLL